MIRKIKRWLKPGRHHKYINGGRGVISILLMIVMLPFLSLAMFVIESGRYHEAISVADEMIKSAELSTLANYDDYMMDRFGLLAINQEDGKSKREKYFKKYMADNLSAYKSLKINGDGAIKIEPQYTPDNMSDIDVLRYEILEAAKYAGPTALAGDYVINELQALFSSIPGISQVESISAMVSATLSAISPVYDLAEDIVYVSYYAGEINKTIDQYEDKAGKYINAINEVYNKKQAYANAQAELENANSTLESSNEKVKKLEEKREKTQKKIDELDENDSNYDSKLENLQEKLDEIDEQIKSAEEANKDASNAKNDAQTACDNASSEYDTAKANYSTAQSEYSGLILPLINDKAHGGLLENYNSYAEELQGDIVSVGTAGVDFFKAYDELRDELVKAQKDNLENNLKNDKNLSEEDKASTQAQIKRLGDEADEISKEKTKDDLEKAAGTGIKNLNEVGTDFEKEYNKNKVDKAKLLLLNIKKNVDSLKAENINTTISRSNENYYTSIDNLRVCPKNAFKDLMDKLDKIFSGEAWENFVNTASAVIKPIKDMFKTDLFYDPDLCANVSYAQEGSNPNSELASLPDDIKTLNTSFNNMITGNAALVALNWIPIVNSFLFINYVKAIMEFLVALWNVCSKIISCAKEMIGNIATFFGNVVSKGMEYIKDRVVLNEYYLKMLPNRTNFASGTASFTGYKFEDIELTPKGTARTHASNLLFCGAELEYLMGGFSDEYANQTVAFMELYIMRFLIDVLPVVLNNTVHEVLKAVAEVPYVGIILDVIILAVWLIAEPVVDMVLLVNGSQTYAIKFQIYLSKEGFPELLKSLTSSKLKKAFIDDKTKKAFNVSDEEADALSADTGDTGGTGGDASGGEADALSADTGDTGGTGGDASGGEASSEGEASSGSEDKPKMMGIIKNDYLQQMGVLILFVGNDDRFIERFQKLVEMEERAYLKGEKKADYEKYKLSEAYVSLNGSVTAEYKEVLPIGSMSEGGLFKFKRTHAMGY